MFKIKTYIFPILFCLISCTQPEIQKDFQESIEFPVVIDTSTVAPLEIRKTWLNTAHYQIYYIGSWNDTLPFEYYFRWYLRPALTPASKYYSEIFEDTIRREEWFCEARVPYQKYLIGWMSKESALIDSKKAKLDIFIDTSQHVLNKGFDAYPVMVKNMDSDTVRITSGDFIPLLMEARNEKGIWKEIEKPWRYACGNGLVTIILPPNEILLTSAYCYTGPMKTQMRLKIGENYSNPFFGSIHPRQFENIFNEHGE